MIELIKRYSKSSIFVSILLIIFSIALMLKPMESLNMIISIFGILVLINGITNILSYIKTPKEFSFFNFELTIGILECIFGTFCIINPGMIGGIINVAIGVWILMSSVIRFQVALDIKNIGDKNYVILLVLSVVTFILSLLLITDPFSSIMALTTIIGVCMFISEIINIVQYVIILIKVK